MGLRHCSNWPKLDGKVSSSPQFFTCRRRHVPFEVHMDDSDRDNRGMRSVCWERGVHLKRQRTFDGALHRRCSINTQVLATRTTRICHFCNQVQERNPPEAPLINRSTERRTTQTHRKEVGTPAYGAIDRHDLRLEVNKCSRMLTELKRCSRNCAAPASNLMWRTQTFITQSDDLV